MKVDVSPLLVMLANRAARHQDTLQRYLEQGHKQMGRALGEERDRRTGGFDEEESLEWASRAQVARAQLGEVQALIEMITRECGAAAMAGKVEA